MSATNFTPISLYYSSTAAAVPSAGNLVAGELALNTNDGKLYYKNSSGVVTLLAGATSGPAGGSTTQVQYNNAGVLAGITGATTNGTALTLTAPVLGTPASGTVTNLTGTASININGTVGATTPAAGAFTTLTSTLDATIYGVTVGRGAGAVSTNTAVGASALAGNTSGTNSVAVGASALAGQTSGGFNTAVGQNSMSAIVTGSSNTAVGVNSMVGNTSGANNAAFGGAALFTNNSGANNTAIGSGALQLNTTASNNTAVGYQAGYSNTTSAGLVAVGYQSAYQATGGGNVAIGRGTLFASGAGASNTAVGDYALNLNTSGGTNAAFGAGSLGANTTGSQNTALGGSALVSNTTASNNTAVGYQAGYSITVNGYNVFLGNATGKLFTGLYNTCVGAGAGSSSANSSNSNTLVGYAAGYNSSGAANTFVGAASTGGTGCGEAMTTGSKNTILGAYSGNQGSLDIRTASNYIVLSDGDGNPNLYVSGNNTYLNAPSGNTTLIFSAVNVIKWYQYNDAGNSNRLTITSNFTSGVYLAATGTSWTSNSDERLKTEIVPFENAAAKVASLRAGTGRYLTDAEGTSRSFLIAQDVQAVLPEAVDVSQDEMRTLGLAYTDVIPLLVAAIKELKAIIDTQANRITALENK